MDLGEGIDRSSDVPWSTDQNLLRHTPADDQLPPLEPQYEGAARAVALDFHLDAGNQTQGREMGAHGPSTVDGYEANFAAGAGHCKRYLICGHARFPVFPELGCFRLA